CTTAARLFTTDYNHIPLRANPLVWLDNERVAFLWNDGKKPTQVLILNLRTQHIDVRTDHPTDVSSFNFSRDGSAILYTAVGQHSKDSAEKMLREGFAVPSNALLYDLMVGHLDGWGPLWYPEAFVSPNPSTPARKIELGSQGNAQGMEI